MEVPGRLRLRRTCLSASVSGGVARLSAGVIVACLAVVQAEAAALHLRFPGLQPGGMVVVAVFDSEATWNKRDEPRVRHIGDAGQPVHITFEALPDGEYAVMAYHDRNGDGQLNTNFLGIPTEPYGFSNDARGMFGPPGWGKARFSLSQQDKTLELRLR